MPLRLDCCYQLSETVRGDDKGLKYLESLEFRLNQTLDGGGCDGGGKCRGGRGGRGRVRRGGGGGGVGG